MSNFDQKNQNVQRQNNIVNNYNISEPKPVGFFPKFLAFLGGTIQTIGFGSFAYFIISFMGLVFGSSQTHASPDISGLNFNLVIFGVGLALVGTVISAIAGSMGARQWYSTESSKR